MVDSLKVGWCVDAPLAEFAFADPKPVRRDRDPALSGRAVQACPAVNDLERRLFQVEAAFDIELAIERRGDHFDLLIVSSGTRIDRDVLGRFLTFMRPDLWRSKEHPVIQILVPYFFICDEDCYMTQLPPFLSVIMRKWPGLFISGRFPIRNWPRIMNWAFEWTDFDETLRIKRGDPLCYFLFEANDPSRAIKLLHVELTEKIRNFRKGVDGIPKLMANTFQAMSIAESRRPRKIMLEDNND